VLPQVSKLLLFTIGGVDVPLVCSTSLTAEQPQALAAMHKEATLRARVCQSDVMHFFFKFLTWLLFSLSQNERILAEENKQEQIRQENLRLQHKQSQQKQQPASSQETDSFKKNGTLKSDFCTYI
jgi:hypothetical protein